MPTWIKAFKPSFDPGQEFAIERQRAVDVQKQDL
jgi:hypothetical protein